MSKEERQARRAERKANRKPFKETGLGRFLKGAGSTITDTIGDVLPDKGVLGVVKNLISNDTELSPEDRETALKLLEMDAAEMENISKRWESDMTSDSWLSKNVRPITLLYLLIVMTILVVLDSVQNTFSVKTGWVNLIEGLLITVVFAYFGSRGAEKWAKIRKN